MLARLLGIRDEDRRNTTVAFVTLLGIMTAHALLETARDALFLSKLPARELPWAYVAIAGVSLVVATVSRRLFGSGPRRRTLASLLLAGAVITFSFQRLVSNGTQVTLVLLYVWTGLLATIVVVEFWLLVARVLDFGQAKRVFAIVAAGGLLGATLGGGLASALLVAFPPRSLLAVAAGVFAATAFAPLCFSKARPTPAFPRRARELPSSWRALLREDPYLRRLLMATLASSTLLTGVDFVFKATASVDLAPDQLAPFFARFYGTASAVALLVQLFVAPRLLRTLGVNGSLLVLPSLLLFGSAGFVLYGGLGAAIAMRGADGALRHSLHRTGTEILYVPLSPAVRDRFKSFVEAVGQRGGQAVASLLLLGAIALHLGPADIGAVLFALAAIWLVASVGIKPHYLELFRKNLREGVLESHVEVPDLDLHSLEALIGALSSDNDHEVTAALDLLSTYGKSNLVPALILYHPSPEVVLHAFSLFSGAGRTDVDRLVDRLIHHDDERIRAAALRYTASRAETWLLESMAEDPSPFVRTTAVVELIRRGTIDEQQSAAVLSGIIEDGAPELRRSLAFAARDLPTGRYSWVLVRLALLRDPDLAREAARSMAAAPDVQHVPTLVRLLSVRDCREDARAAILALGGPALGALEAALADVTLPRTVRRHLPRTLLRFGGPAAARIIERRIPIEVDEVVEHKLVRALGRMRSEDPSLSVDRAMLIDEARIALSRAITLLFWQITTARAPGEDSQRRTPVAEILGALLSDKEAGALERVFRILMALDPAEDFDVLLAGLRSDDARLRETGRELVSHVVPEPLRGGILAMLDHAPPEERLRGAVRFYDPVGRARYEQAAARLAQNTDDARRGAHVELEAVHVECLRSMLLDTSDALRGVASYRIAELGLGQLEVELRSAASDNAGALAELTDRAVDLLDRQQAEVSRAG